jgi:hypothetical protein
MATAQRYPLSTADGTAIPLEVVKPLATTSVAFSVSSFASVTVNTEWKDKIFVAYSDTDCYINFSATPAAVVDKIFTVNTIFVAAGTIVAFVINSTSLHVIGTSAAGTAHISIMDTWAGLMLERQIGSK